jgi:hypothetical protein
LVPATNLITRFDVITSERFHIDATTFVIPHTDGKLHPKAVVSDPQLSPRPKVLRNNSFPPRNSLVRPFVVRLKFEVALGRIVPARTVGFAVQLENVMASRFRNERPSERRMLAAFVHRIIGSPKCWVPGANQVGTSMKLNPLLASMNQSDQD